MPRVKRAQRVYIVNPGLQNDGEAAQPAMRGKLIMLDERDWALLHELSARDFGNASRLIRRLIRDEAKRRGVDAG
jgi:hypothetical protein